MTEEDYIELVIFVEQYQKRDKLDRTQFSEAVYKESKARIENYKKQKTK
jgi:hypothetical protein